VRCLGSTKQVVHVIVLRPLRHIDIDSARIVLL
jgi:hypothetical protein